MNINEYLKLDENEKPLDRMVSDGGFCGIFRTIGVIGDSLASGELESVNPDGSKSDHDFYEYSWGQYMARDIGCKVYNFSRGGMSAKPYMQNFEWPSGFGEYTKLCQAYIIALGVNDLFGAKMELGSIEDINQEDYTKNADTFAGWYARIIQKHKEMQPKAKFFLVSFPRHGKDDKYEQRIAHRQLLEDMAKIFDNTYLIDLWTYGPDYDEEFYKRFFRGHMNPAGYLLTARMIESYMDYIIRHNAEDFAEVGFIGTNLSYNKD